MSGCLKGEINMAIQSDDLAKARQSAAEFRDIFGAENFFLEMHDHGIEAQHKCNADSAAAGEGIRASVWSQPTTCIFSSASHHEAHDVMICIGTGKMVHDERRMRYVPELYFKSPEEMRALFPDYPERDHEHARDRRALQPRAGIRRVEISRVSGAGRQDARSVSARTLLQGSARTLRRSRGNRFGADQASRLRSWTCSRRPGSSVTSSSSGTSSTSRKQRGIPVGPGRGSAAGSLVAYVLGITDIDPLQFGLLFERFLNPERVSPPDIDVDFCEARRGEVLEYVRQKYGERRVSQIITFGKMNAKSVVRDVGRVIGLSYGEADRLAKMIPERAEHHARGRAPRKLRS